MSVLTLHDSPDPSEWKRYGLAAVAIVALHAIAITAAIGWHRTPATTGIVIDAIMVDLTPPPSAPEIQKDDVAEDTPMQEAAPPPPEPVAEEKIEQIPPTPEQEQPVVAAPPKVEPKPEPKPDPKPQPKPKPRENPKQVSKKPPAPKTAAAPKAERVGPMVRSTSNAAAAAAAARDYRSMVYSHLVRFKRNSSAGEGVVTLSFALGRQGQLLSSGIARSSGNPALDQEALAMVRRASPYPPFPSEMTKSRESFTAPVRFLGR